MPRFTHLLREDAELLKEYLDSVPGRYVSIEFDVHVGQGRDPGPEFDPNIRQMALILSMRRIDAVAYSRSRIDVIEVTQLADLKALGQLKAYPILLRELLRINSPMRPVLVTRRFGTDLQELYQKSNIHTVIFPA